MRPSTNQRTPRQINFNKLYGKLIISVKHLFSSRIRYYWLFTMLYFADVLHRPTPPFIYDFVRRRLFWNWKKSVVIQNFELFSCLTITTQTPLFLFTIFSSAYFKYCFSCLDVVTSIISITAKYLYVHPV